MTAPRFAACRCAHDKSAHDHPELRPQCTAPGCTCLQYRPAVATARPTTTPGSAHTPAAAPPVQPRPVARPGEQGPELRPPSFEQLVAAAKRSTSVSTRRSAERVEKQLIDLRARLLSERAAADRKRREDEEKAAARREVARLEEQLAQAKARLRPNTSAKKAAPPVPSTPSVACIEPGCDRTFATTQARAMHHRRAHEGFDPRAAKAG